MTEHTPKILLVEPNAEMLERMVAPLARELHAHITCVPEGGACLDVELLDPHDLVLAEIALDDMCGLALASRLTALSERPVMLMANNPRCDQVLEAMRLGVVDVLRKPVARRQLVDSVRRTLRTFELRRRHAVKYRRMRDLVRQVIRERRNVNRRVELICRDLVGAQRRLVQRVMALEEFNARRMG